MTKQQAIKVAQQSANKNKRPYAVVYDVSYAEVYGEADAFTVATMGDLDTFYSAETPVFVAEPN